MTQTLMINHLEAAVIPVQGRYLNSESNSRYLLVYTIGL